MVSKPYGDTICQTRHDKVQQKETLFLTWRKPCQNKIDINSDTKIFKR